MYQTEYQHKISSVTSLNPEVLKAFIKPVFGGIRSRWISVTIKSPPADSSGSQPNVNHILDSESTCLKLWTRQPGNTKPSVCHHKAQTGFTLVKFPEKGDNMNHRLFSVNDHIVGENCCGDIQATVNLHEALRKAKQRCAFYEAVTSVCSWTHQT